MASTSAAAPLNGGGDSRVADSEKAAALEMNKLAPQSQSSSDRHQTDPNSQIPPHLTADPISDPQQYPNPTTMTDSQTQDESADRAPSTSANLATVVPHKTRSRAESEAIGPATDNPTLKPDPSGGPVVLITLLLISGARHPYKIDEKYLRKRNVNVEEMNPFNISVYTLKELIWRDWREEWEPRPSSPSSIRLIHFGRLLDDKLPLKDCRFNAESPNVVHMTVKPQEVAEEEDPKAGKLAGRDRDGGERTAGCRCVIL